MNNYGKALMIIEEEVTIEYLTKATPKEGRILFESGYNYSCHEVEINMAEWIYNNFGGNIILLAENNKPFGCKYSDYEWNDKNWELKTLKTESAIDSAIRKAISQIYNNPGGIIVDFGKNKININKVETLIKNRIKSNCHFKIDVIIIINSKLQKVLRYNK